MRHNNNIPDADAYNRNCTLGELSQIQFEIETVLQSWYEDDIKLNFSVLAIIEVLANIFEHGFDTNQQTSPKVELNIQRDDTQAKALISDNGLPVPEEAVNVMSGKVKTMPKIEVPQEELPESGWGLNLVQHATTAVSYKREKQQNYLELTFDTGTSK